MASIGPRDLFSVGFSEPVKIRSSELDKYVSAFRELTNQVRSEIAETKGVSTDSVDENSILLSTMVSQKEGGVGRLVLENCSNMNNILSACQEKQAKIDQKTLARLDALLNAALDEKLQVIYKEQEINVDTGQKQELMILSHFATGEAPQLKSLEVMFGVGNPESSTTVTSAQFSENYKDKLKVLQGLWVNSPTQDVEEFGLKGEIEEPKIIGLKDNPEGSADDEGERDRLDAKENSVNRSRIEDDAKKRLHEEEERKNRQNDAKDRMIERNQ
ncbi:putative uncharacterized protein [Waddlia chondrophila 2032/99]|uniref:Uncharacterized protein n=2 Tax=Waddlia chondrophila TaxID=71667 RepID=D6YWY7_WADCW|nr:hypothetical protein [Waddlia chondrophila]ADI38648.1 hypothetical protein wcw_1296 [Waddlia chondrophila WSU 86-1044]CCB90803.1 putative uncharacterized protein [Waddlia chondrophila 2032/99]